MANCKYCGKSIFWMKEGSKNRPFEEDGTPHECEDFKNSRKVTKVERGELDPDLIKELENRINSKK